MHGLTEINRLNERATEAPGIPPVAVQVTTLREERILRTVAEATVERLSIEKDYVVRNKLALGYFVGAFTALTAVGDPATAAFANRCLRQISAGGYAAVQNMLLEITGQRPTDQVHSEYHRRLEAQYPGYHASVDHVAAGIARRAAETTKRVAEKERVEAARVLGNAIWPDGTDLSGAKPEDRLVAKSPWLGAPYGRPATVRVLETANRLERQAQARRRVTALREQAKAAGCSPEVVEHCEKLGREAYGKPNWDRTPERADVVKDALGVDVYALAAKHHGVSVTSEGSDLVLSFASQADLDAAVADLKATIERHPGTAIESSGPGHVCGHCA